jgi:DNA-binding transcriptional regulator YiaG
MKNAEAKTIRTKLKLTQGEFWSRVAVTQSGGSRYESGRPIPAPVQKLLLIAYGKPNVSNKIVADLRKGAV